MISDEDLDALIYTESLNFEQRLPNNLSEFKELKQRRESDLRPATKFLGQELETLFYKLGEELDEIKREFYDGDGDVEFNPRRLAEEIVDLQMACETFLAAIGANEADRDEVRRQVIEKNQRRGYYEGAVSNK